MALYDQIGVSYDTTRRENQEITRRMVHLLDASETGKYLDMACGSGNYTIAMKSAGGMNMVGADVSEQMLERAGKKDDRLDWIQADVHQLPFEDRTFQGVTCMLSIHHFNDLKQAFAEIFRVMDAGRFVLFTSCPTQMEHYWLNHYFPQAMRDSIKQMPRVESVLEELKECGFAVHGVESLLVQPNLQDFFLYSGKHRPAMYVDEHVRKGISIFQQFGQPDEVSRGVRQLEEDIKSGHIVDVQNQYTSLNGDYTFIVAEKK
ncbi:class I SAM-dependent methyltransferase [Paenalkalicoccus suaedae]|uniref:class I SAM-dependent methyltransferase n=1 Tax=Paenalkalicoccus suaedae TaxID=2592382 RepID=UPI00201BE701|nr:class I SAM-dependent methyltransferase [Paenalkalicoccus suaedae]